MYKLIWVYLILMSGQTFAEQIKLPGSAGNLAKTGSDVEISGDWAFSGAPGGDGNSNNSGVVLVYKKEAGTWIKKDSIMADDGMSGDSFGYAISLDNNRLVVGAWSDDVEVGGTFYSNLGSAYVFELNQEDSWVQTAKIISNNLAAKNYFGYELSLDNDRLFVGAEDSGQNINGAIGAVYVFDLLDGQWQQTAKIKEQNSTEPTFLGEWEIVLDGNLAFIPEVIEFGQNVSGRVNVYEKQGSAWNKISEINSPTIGANDYFGYSLGYLNGRLVVGALKNDNSNGKVFVFELENSVWVEQASIGLPLVPGTRYCGHDVELTKDQLFFGCLHDNGGHFDEGAVYIYNYNGETWDFHLKVTAVGYDHNNLFGDSISVDYDQLLIGAPGNSGMTFVQDIEPNSVRFEINQGLNGNWYNPDTSGQGIFLDVKPEYDYAYMGWFTYDTQLAAVDELGQIGAAGHRWLVGNGTINQSTNSIKFGLFYAADGLFDDAQAVTLPEVDAYGSMTMIFNDDCFTATVTYEIPSQDLFGEYIVTRSVVDSTELCAAFAQGPVEAPVNAFDISLNGHWYNPDTLGQGIFVEQFAGTTQAFMGWFTYDTSLVNNPVMSQVGADGQRWLVGSGSVNADNVNILDFDLLYAAGGLFDDPTTVTVKGTKSNATMSIEFFNCGEARVNYDIPAENLSGSYHIIKLLTDVSQDCPTEN